MPTTLMRGSTAAPPSTTMPWRWPTRTSISSHSNIVSDIYDDLYERIRRRSDTLMKRLFDEFRAAHEEYHLESDQN